MTLNTQLPIIIVNNLPTDRLFCKDPYEHDSSPFVAPRFIRNNPDIYSDSEDDEDLLMTSDYEFVEDYSYEESEEEGEGEGEPFLEDEDLPYPFWFTYEEDYHIQEIIETYHNELVSVQECCRSNRLFIGRVERTCASSNKYGFKTFDKVTIANCQKMPTEKLILPTVRTEYCLTTWDNDGLPSSIIKLKQNQICYWQNDLRERSSHFLFSSPNFSVLGEVAETEFRFSASRTFQEITYFGIRKGFYSEYLNEPKSWRQAKLIFSFNTTEPE